MKTMKRSHFVLGLLIAGTLLATTASFWKAPYPAELKLQHLPTLIGLVLLTITVRKKWLGAGSVLCLLAFLWLHIVGARWIYSYVPYDDWFRTFTGQRLSERFGWSRNHYDRLVHFASGVLFVPPIREVVLRGGLTSRWGVSLIAISGVLAIGAIYEIAEWQVAVIFAPEYAEAYNGQQGDLWDPQKDLALAGLGALLCATGMSWRNASVPWAKSDDVSPRENAIPVQSR